MLVPVLAELEARTSSCTTAHAHTVDKEASAGIVALQAPDGRTALPVFTSVATMAAWRADARPVPSDVARAALSAVTEGWEVLVVDPGGPTTVARPAARRVGARAAASRGGRRYRRTVVDPEVRDAVAAAVAPVRGRGARRDAVPGRRAEVAVVLALVARPRPGRARRGAGAGQRRAGGVEVVAARVDSLELRPRARAASGGA